MAGMVAPPPGLWSGGARGSDDGVFPLGVVQEGEQHVWGGGDSDLFSGFMRGFSSSGQQAVARGALPGLGQSAELMRSSDGFRGNDSSHCGGPKAASRFWQHDDRGEGGMPGGCGPSGNAFGGFGYSGAGKEAEHHAWGASGDRDVLSGAEHPLGWSGDFGNVDASLLGGSARGLLSSGEQPASRFAPPGLGQRSDPMRSNERFRGNDLSHRGGYLQDCDLRRDEAYGIDVFSEREWQQQQPPVYLGARSIDQRVNRSVGREGVQAPPGLRHPAGDAQ